MKWFRSNIKSGARLALFALFVQFALSFGHFHALVAPARAAPSTLPSISIVDAGDLTVESLANQQAPAKQDGSMPASWISPIPMSVR